MIPILLISRNPKDTEKYIIQYASDRGISPAFIFSIHPATSVISIDQIREIKSALARRVNSQIIVVIHSFHTAKKEAQNAFLKTLEEKSQDCLFLLVAQDASQVLDTIISRVRIIRLKEKNAMDLMTKDHKSKDFTLSLDSVKDKDKALEMADQLINEYRFHLYNGAENDEKAKKIAEILKETLRVKSLICYSNLNPQYALDHLYFFIKKLTLLILLFF